MSTLQVIPGSIYDCPKYYDLIFGSEWKSELEFIEDLFEKYVPFKVKRLFEPACGTGRLLFRFGKAGYTVSGNDLNDKAIEFCNARLSRHELTGSCNVEDMTDFRIANPVDAAFNTINSFRHLESNRDATSHLKCMAKSLNPGGIYIVGLHLSPAVGNQTTDTESWTASRGTLTVTSRMWLEERNYSKRFEKFGLTFDVETPNRQFRIQDEVKFRTYTYRQFQNLVKTVPQFSLAGIYDFRYDVDEEIELDETTEDVVFVLQRL